MDDEIPTVFQELNIEYGPFTIEEYLQWQRSWSNLEKEFLLKL